MFKKLKKNMPVVVSLLFALVAGVLVFFSVQAVNRTVSVVVAKTNLSVGTEITKDNVTVKRIPSVAVPETAVRSLDDAVGRVISGGPVLAGDILRAEHISAEGSLAAALATFAPDGRVAVQLASGTGTGLQGIRRGDVVDIYGEVRNEQGATAGLIAKNAIIIATPWVSASAAEKGGEGCYVVAVTPEEAETLAALDAKGQKVSLVLKPKYVLEQEREQSAKQNQTGPEAEGKRSE